MYFWLILTIFSGGGNTNLGVERQQRGVPPTNRALQVATRDTYLRTHGGRNSEQWTRESRSRKPHWSPSTLKIISNTTFIERTLHIELQSIVSTSIDCVVQINKDGRHTGSGADWRRRCSGVHGMARITSSIMWFYTYYRFEFLALLSKQVLYFLSSASFSSRALSPAPLPPSLPLSLAPTLPHSAVFPASFCLSPFRNCKQ